MKVSCKILSTPTSDAPGTCLIVHFDNKRYLIGHIGEGAQRAFTERRTRLMKVTDVFLSGRTEWENTGGLVGLILTMGDTEEGKLADIINTPPKTSKTIVEKKTMTVHGGQNLMHTLATARAFVFRKAMKLKISEIPESLRPKEPVSNGIPYFMDENLIVRPMHIHPDSSQRAKVIVVDQEKPSPVEGKSTDEDDSRKRSFKKFSEKEKSREDVLRGVVENMFCSNWTMDTMIEDSVDAPAGRPVNENDMMRNPTSRSPSPSSPSKRPRGFSPMRGTIIDTPTDRNLQLSTRPPPPGKTRAPWPASTVRQLPRSKPSPIAISYLLTLHSQRGKFLPNKAIGLGIKPGKDFGLLVAGETLVAADGTKVRPEDVMEPTRPGTGIAVCDLPDATYINDFLAQEEWKDVERVKVEIGCFFWILGEGLVVDERLTEFMKNFAHARHIVSAIDVCPNIITYKGAARAATKLSLMDEGYFPLPHASTIPSRYLEGIESAIPGMVWQVEPKWELQKDKVEEVFSVEKALKETEPEYSRLAEVVRVKNQETLVEGSEDSPWRDVEVITLGTGSALPSKYRNVSATLVRVPGAGSVLFDCGEGTLGQLKRLYPPIELAEILRDLKAIYISHLHADHHLGTVSVLRSWCKELHHNNGALNGDGTMSIVAPWKFLVWLREYADVEEYGFSKIRFVSCEDILAKARGQSSNTSISSLPEILSSLSLADIQTSPAIHCQGSFTTAWTWQNGFKLAYSGDTRPTRGFVEIGKDATVLLHEATFDDELLAEAIAKKHSTTSEALAAGRDMGAKGVILTHFSQRYPKLPVLSAEGDGDLNVVLAFDLCRIRLGNIGRFARFLPALRELYKDEDSEPAGEIGEEEEEEEEEETKEVLTIAKGKGGKEKKEKKQKKKPEA